ncbi:unnamed protein product [Caenorhabditis bovis]|uniref:V-type proton ATPase subunit S1/VOA1 transmembrane domain-containing protein n=1 Tax=Caenorhabditis bovis TaxID=2654633 RepID=A0A8S1F0L2_9PELO|nr:unnamed protein product [Caenorhabditis bovis]
MRVLLAALCAIAAVSAYDAVYFSNKLDVSKTKIEDVLKSASKEEPVVFIVNPDFTLGQFSVKANAYSTEPSDDFLVKTVKGSRFHGVEYFANQLYTDSAKVITSSDQFTAGASVYIIAGEEWISMEQLAEELISKIDNSVAVITSSDAISHDKNRVKRVATSEMEEGATGNTGSTGSPNKPDKYVAMPLILPPYNQSDYPDVKPKANLTCLFYLEGLTVVVAQNNGKTVDYVPATIREANVTWGYADGDVSCPTGTIGEFKFRVRLNTAGEIPGTLNKDTYYTIPGNSPIEFTLTITGDLFGYWKLTDAVLHTITISGSKFKSVTVDEKTIGKVETQFSGIESVAGWSLACGQSQAIFFPTSDESVKVGISLYNTQIQTFNLLDHWTERARFTLQVEDCTGTFSPGSWMGIVASLTLVAGLLFGYLMLQSVQTMDRFDDPKHKQIVINVRE